MSNYQFSLCMWIGISLPLRASDLGVTSAWRRRDVDVTSRDVTASSRGKLPGARVFFEFPRNKTSRCRFIVFHRVCCITYYYLECVANAIIIRNTNQVSILFYYCIIVLMHTFALNRVHFIPVDESIFGTSNMIFRGKKVFNRGSNN